jgi:hypothetical protein
MKTLEKLKYWVVFYGPKTIQILFVIFYIRMGYAVFNYYYFSLFTMLNEYYCIIPEGKILGTSPTPDSHSESDDGQSKKPESRDAMAEKARINRDANFKEHSTANSGIGYGTYEGTNHDGRPCSAFDVTLKAGGFELYQHDSINCGDSVEKVDAKLHEGVQAGLEKQAPKLLVNQDIVKAKEKLDYPNKKK